MKKLIPIAKAEAALDESAQSALRALGAALRAERATRGLTRDQFGQRILVSRATLQRMEAGDPRVAVGYLLAAGSMLGVPVLATEVEQQGRPQMPPVRVRASRKRSSDEWFK